VAELEDIGLHTGYLATLNIFHNDISPGIKIADVILK
jgi:hypothetical protein